MHLNSQTRIADVRGLYALNLPEKELTTNRLFFENLENQWTLNSSVSIGIISLRNQEVKSKDETHCSLNVGSEDQDPMLDYNQLQSMVSFDDIRPIL